MQTQKIAQKVALVALVFGLTACGSYAPAKYSASARLGAKVCTEEYQPQLCSIGRGPSGEELSPPWSANGANRCDAERELEKIAAFRGVSEEGFKKLSIDCEPTSLN